MRLEVPVQFADLAQAVHGAGLIVDEVAACHDHR
jgi:hypothetical protein